MLFVVTTDRARCYELSRCVSQRWIFLGNDDQTSSMCFDDWVNVSVRQGVKRLRHMRMLFARGLYGYCNCINTTARGAHIRFHTIVLCRRNFANGDDIFLHSVLWTDEAFFFTREGVFKFHSSNFCSRANEDIKFLKLD